MAYFRVAGASEYLAITGFRINDIKLVKKAWILPGQVCSRFDISPVNYTFEIKAMSSEKIPFILPAVFTIGPRTDDPEALLRYAKLIAQHDKLSSHVKELVEGVIEGETRVLTASMTMEGIFRGTKEFKQAVFENVQLELTQFGLIIYNANVKQLVDVRGSEYFSLLGQKTQQEAANQAKVDVAEARMKGEIGAKVREGETKQNAAKVDAETKIYSKQREGEAKMQEVKVITEVKIYENKREAEVAEANLELAKKKASWDREAKLAQVEATKAVAIREAVLQMEVERMNALCATEKLKAVHLSKAMVENEIKVLEANFEVNRKQKAAETLLYEQKQIAEGRRSAAEAEFFARGKEADAQLYAKQKEAEGLLVMANAQSTYIDSVLLKSVRTLFQPAKYISTGLSKLGMRIIKKVAKWKYFPLPSVMS